MVVEGAKGNRAKPYEAEPKRVLTSELVGLHEIGERLGWHNSTVANWAIRYIDFPKPVAWLHAGRVWYWPDILEWATKTGRQPL